MIWRWLRKQKSELANPNTALASVKFKFQHRIYKGDLPDVDGEDSTILLFQPTLPFPLKNGKTLYVRPGIPLIFDQPVADGITFTSPGDPSIGLPDPSEIEFSSKSGIGDATIDDWQRHYNHVRPHRSLGKKPPAVFAKEAA